MSALQRSLSRIPWAYVARRLLIAIPTLLVIITVAFFMMRMAPGGPFDGEKKLPQATMDAINAKFGLDQPLWKQYTDYLWGVIQLDFGPSMKTLGKSVNDMISDGLPISLSIGFLSMGLAIVVGTTLGIFAGLRQNTAGDYTVMGFAMAGISIPTFVSGPILILLFALGAGIFAVGGLGTYPNIGMTFHNMTLPVVTLALPQIAIISRLMRASMIETMRSGHIRTARAKGLSERQVIMKHALPAAILPLVSYAGPAMARVMTGSLVIEKIFGLPGMGTYFVDGAINRDYTLVMGALIIYATLIVLFNLIADVLYALLDPKVKYD
ncbi:ABC transporter permease subunit [Hyphomonas sp. FCG-A18]|uniref:ABC transporter permease n=1 Tax=Hyphomonas sp. FCG-A18 TaxID=3080019 RepID=UPI002B3227BD|nr:ABC transporter permease subunit [Hyphomonas sp. FCG-A18]